jgi:hypothetical protein
MSVTNTPRKAGPYTGNDTDVEFTFNFKVFAASDLVVTSAVVATGAESTLVLTTDYAATLNADQDNDPGGYITLVSALASTRTLTLTSAVPDTQPAVFTNLGGFFPAVLNNALDRLTILVQQISEKVNRSLKLAVSTPAGFDAQLPAPVAYGVLGFNGAADGFAVTDTTGTSARVADLIADLADGTDAAKGGGLVGFGATLNYVVGTLGYAMQSRGLTVRDFWESGDADWAPASRRALDNAAAGSGSTIGGQVFFPPGAYSIPTTVYIPRSNAPIRIYGHGAVITGAGAGSGTIFETAQGTASTGATSSFGTNELYLHYGTVFEGLAFKNCEFALKLNNFLQGCVIRDNMAISGVKTLVYGRRCFYMNVLNNAVLTSYDSAVTADTEACFRFEDNNNGMVVQGNSALRSAITKGAGFYFSAGTSGVIFHGNTAERCNKGLVIEGAVYTMSVKGNFFEGNTVDLAIEDANYKYGLDVDENWFYSATAIQAVSWFSGTLGASNRYQGSGAVTINNSLGADGAINSLHVWLPRQVLDESAARSTAVVPANWLLNGSCVVHRQASTYLSATGPSAPRALLTESSLGPTMIAAHNFVGDPGLKRFYAADGGLPYCTVTNNTSPGPGTIVVTTQIAWDTYATGARFDFVVVDSINTFRICGWVSGTTVFRDDALAQTCVASISGGKLVLTLGNFTVGDIAGGVRIL